MSTFTSRTHIRTAYEYRGTPDRDSARTTRALTSSGGGCTRRRAATFACSAALSSASLSGASYSRCRSAACYMAEQLRSEHRRVLPAVLVLALLSWLSCIYEQAAFADPTLFNIRPASPSPIVLEP